MNNPNQKTDTTGDLKFYNRCGTFLAKGFCRIVKCTHKWKSGAYVEFEYQNIAHESFFVPKKLSFRIFSLKCHFVQLHSLDDCETIMYEQRKHSTHGFIGNYNYILLSDLFTEDGTPIEEYILAFNLKRFEKTLRKLK